MKQTIMCFMIIIGAFIFYLVLFVALGTGLGAAVPWARRRCCEYTPLPSDKEQDPRSEGVAGGPNPPAVPDPSSL